MTLPELVKDLAAEAQTEIIQKIHRMDIKETYALLNSINAVSESNNKDYHAVIISFNYIAKFIELGVGRNQKYKQAGKRKPRLFISPVTNKIQKKFFIEALKVENETISNLLKISFSDGSNGQ